VSGATISGGGSAATREAGFVVQFLGSYSTINFQYTNINTTTASFGFTTGLSPVPTPGPLPILGIGAALSQGRKLRRLIHQRGGRRFAIR